MIRRSLCELVVVLFMVLVIGPAASSGARVFEPDLWGTGTNIHYVGAEDFNCSDPTGNCSCRNCGDDFWCDPSGYRDVYAPVRLPAGALIQGYRVVYDDSSASLDYSIRLYRSYQWNTVKGSQEIQNWMSSGSPGVTNTWVDVDPDHTVYYRYFSVVSYGHNSYYFWVTLPPTSFVQFRGALVYWNRQISPAPAEATFADVPVGAFGFRHVEALAASGITAAAATTFAPTSP